MKKKTLVVLGAIAILTLAAGTWAWYWSRNVLVLENATDKTARVVTVTVCRMSYRVEDLAPGRTTRIHFEVTGDSGFQVDATLEDGTEISGNFGYVTGGAGAYHNRARVRIHETGIEGKLEY